MKWGPVGVERTKEFSLEGRSGPDLATTNTGPHEGAAPYQTSDRPKSGQEGLCGLSFWGSMLGFGASVLGLRVGEEPPDGFWR